MSGRHRVGKLGLGGAVGRHDPNSPHEGGGDRRVSTCWVIRLSPDEVIVVVVVVVVVVVAVKKHQHHP